MNTNNLSQLQNLRLEYWQEFANYAFQQQKFKEIFSIRKAPYYHNYDIGIIGISTYFLCLTTNSRKNELSTGIYIPSNKHLFDLLYQNKNKIETELAFKIDWKSERENSVASRMRTYLNADIRVTRNLWQQYFDWHIDSAVALYNAVNKVYIS